MSTVRLVTGGPHEQRNACNVLQDRLNEVIDAFSDEYPNFPAVTVLGVLRLVEDDFIKRWQQ